MSRRDSPPPTPSIEARIGYWARQLRPLVLPPPSLNELRLLQTVRPFTMISLPRLRTLYRLANRVLNEGVAGALVECGTWNGGSGAILAKVGARDSREIWLFDSFEGLPPPNSVDGREARRWVGECLGQEEQVARVLGRVHANPERVHIVKGWFNDTLHESGTGRIALLHVDADWYESTRLVLGAFYDRVATGGFLVVDDYGVWPGCRRAVDEFLAERKVAPQIIRSDYAGVAVWFQKP